MQDNRNKHSTNSSNLGIWEIEMYLIASIAPVDLKLVHNFLEILFHFFK